MKATVAFRALNRRRAEERRALLRFVVRPLTKAGAPSKAPMTDQDWRLDATATLEEAEARKAELEGLNPGRRYVVLPL